MPLHSTKTPTRLFDAPLVLAELKRGIAKFLATAPVRPDEGFLSLTLPLSMQIPLVPESGLEKCRYLADPSEGRALLGFGSAQWWRAAGPGRFAKLGQFLLRAAQVWECHDPYATGLPPRAFLGYAFDAGRGPLTGPDLLPNAEIRVPLLLLQRLGDVSAVTFTAGTGHGTQPEEIAKTWTGVAVRALKALTNSGGSAVPRSSVRRITAEPEDTVWIRRAGRAIEAIRAGRLEKVVLTRRMVMAADREFEPTPILRRLEPLHGDCTLFSFSGNAMTILGATPERLVRLSNGHVRSDVLAGTHPPSGGNRLLESPKDIHEHRLVVDAVLSGLTPVCSQLTSPTEPRIRNLSSLQHLWTPVEGRARSGVTLLDLVARLHPTPAVGGSPHRVAMDWLAREGDCRLGWYTGGVGWVSPDGDGEVSVVLRCAVLTGNRATLSAGAGIVADSDPKTEWQETELKMRPMLDALEGG